MIGLVMSLPPIGRLPIYLLGKSSADSYCEIKGSFQKKKKIMLGKYFWEGKLECRIVEEKIVPLSFKLCECQKYHPKILRFYCYVNTTMVCLTYF